MSRRLSPASAAILIVLALLLLTTRSRPNPASASTRLPAAAEAPPAKPGTLDTAFLAGGCFWGVEAVFEHVSGVLSVVSGYSGGTETAPTYEQVSSGATGHAETVRVIFDPAQVSYAQLLRVFFSVAHDPTQLNRQGPDIGPQYRSAIFHKDGSQKKAASAYVDQLTRAKSFSRPIVTQIVPLERFHLAEEYHQDFARRHPSHPYIVYHDAPKVARLKREFAGLYRDQVD